MKTTKTLDALILLTDETDINLYKYIADAIVSYGTDALPLLRKKISTSNDICQQERIESLIYVIEHNDVQPSLVVPLQDLFGGEAQFYENVGTPDQGLRVPMREAKKASTTTLLTWARGSFPLTSRHLTGRCPTGV